MQSINPRHDGTVPGEFNKNQTGNGKGRGKKITVTCSWAHMVTITLTILIDAAAGMKIYVSQRDT